MAFYKTEATPLSWIILGVVIFCATLLGYYINPEARSGFLYYVVIFLFGIVAFCVFAGLVLVPKSKWQILKNKIIRRKTQ